MNKYGLIAQIRRKNPYKMIMKKTQEHHTCDNVLNRNFVQTIPGKTFCTDITYLYYGLNVIQSMSRKGNCVDNAPIESFFGHLKDELDFKSLFNLWRIKTNHW